jgi:hypothetical protein
MKFYCGCEEVTCCCVEVDAHVVAVLCRLPETLGGVAEKAETFEEAVDALTESQSECSRGCELEEVVDVR